MINIVKYQDNDNFTKLILLNVMLELFGVEMKRLKKLEILK